MRPKSAQGPARPSLTYTLLDGRVLDLSGLGEEERAYLARCLASYRDGAGFVVFSQLVDRQEHNPLLRATGGGITRGVANHPLFQAVQDLEFRLGIRQGAIAPDPGDDPARDPLADEWVPAVEAARRKGVTLTGLHKAIRRGDVIARRERPDRSWWVVSANSLRRWTPNPVRQAAGRAGRAAAESARAARRARRG